MFTSILEKIDSHINPQLFREIKGRLTRRNLVLTTIFSLACQGLILLIFWLNLPFDQIGEIASNEYFCRTYLLFKSNRCVGIDWSEWWLDIYNALNLVMFGVLIVGGIYLLVADLIKEKRLGTLNFIRLTPQSSQSIFLGKLLGVPLLIYLGIILVIPLHLWVTNFAGLSLVSTVHFYSVLLSLVFLSYILALWLTILGASQALVITAFLTLLMSPFLHLITFQFYELFKDANEYNLSHYPQWFFIPLVGQNLSIFIILSCGLGMSGLWSLLNRRFINPFSSILSKKQSYLFNFCFQVYVLGLALNSQYQHNILVWTMFIQLFLLLLMGMILPQRQSLQDWARSTNFESRKIKNLPISFSKKWQSIVDLLREEGREITLAMLTNLLLTFVIWLPKFMFMSENNSATLLLGFGLNLTLILMLSVMIQYILTFKIPQVGFWITGLLITLITLPYCLRIMLGMSLDTYPNLWLISATPIVFVIQNNSFSAILLTFLGHTSILALFTRLLTRRIRKLGQSETQVLLNP